MRRLDGGARRAPRADGVVDQDDGLSSVDLALDELAGAVALALFAHQQPVVATLRRLHARLKKRNAGGAIGGELVAVEALPEGPTGRWPRGALRRLRATRTASRASTRARAHRAGRSVGWPSGKEFRRPESFRAATRVPRARSVQRCFGGGFASMKTRGGLSSGSCGGGFASMKTCGGLSSGSCGGGLASMKTWGRCSGSCFGGGFASMKTCGRWCSGFCFGGGFASMNSVGACPRAGAFGALVRLPPHAGPRDLGFEGGLRLGLRLGNALRFQSGRCALSFCAAAPLLRFEFFKKLRRT